jgi:hypothetical protein
MMNSEHIVAQALLRVWPFPRGAGRLIDMFFSNLRFNASEAIVRTTDGFEYLNCCVIFLNRTTSSWT